MCLKLFSSDLSIVQSYFFYQGLTVNRKLVLGVVNCPLIGKLYSATKEGGAFCNGDKIRVR